MSSEKEHILVLGATGPSGIAFIEYVLGLHSPPRLMLYVRNPTKIPTHISSNPRVRVVTGFLGDESTLATALDGDRDGDDGGAGGGVTSVVSFLGAYLTLSAFLLRRRATPIADSFVSLLWLMRARDIRRILALSTPTYLTPDDRPGLFLRALRWVPYLVAPEGEAEMRQIAATVVAFGERDWPGLEYTVFRVPHLNGGDDADAPVSAGMLGHPGYKGSMELSRKSQARWVWEELGKREWVRKLPAIGNC